MCTGVLGGTQGKRKKVNTEEKKTHNTGERWDGTEWVNSCGWAMLIEISFVLFTWNCYLAALFDLMFCG